MSAPAEATYALLNDGSTIEIRPVRAQDAEAVRAMHAAMSPDNAYLRFFSLSPAAAGREARRVCREPDPGHAALLAWQADRLVGVASYEPAGQPATAEVAFAVPDDMHGRGIASLLLEHLVWQARQSGLRAFSAETLAENSAMLRVFADVGLPAKRRISDGVVELTFPLPDSKDNYRLGNYLAATSDRESRAAVASLRPLLRPRSVVVVGVSRRHRTVGRAILRNLVTCGFTGPVYAVSQAAAELEGVPCVASVDDLPGQVDLAVIAVPPSAVLEVAEQCGRNGVRALAVITAALGPAGAELLAICRRHGMRLLGPNCFGVIMPWLRLDATFAADDPLPGVAGVVVQSGGVGLALLEQFSKLGIGVSSFASVGDRYDVSANDMLVWWAQDEVTQIAVLYVESFGSPRKFGLTARRVGQLMPVLTIVGGRSPAGQRAAASHSASAAIPLVTQKALFEQAGVIATTSLGELVETAALLACQPLPAGNRVAIVANAGGAGVLAADACGDHGLEVVKLSAATQRRLRLLLPAGRGQRPGGLRPGGDGGRLPRLPGMRSRGRRRRRRARGGDSVGDLRPERRGGRGGRQQAARGRLPRPGRVRKPAQAEAGGAAGPPARTGAAGGAAAAVAAAAETAAAAAAERPAAIIDEAAAAVTGVPAYADPESAARALAHAVRYQAWLGRHHGTVPELSGLRTADARALVTGFLAEVPAGGWLPGAKAAELLSCYGVPLVVTIPAATEQEAVQAAARLGGRAVLKPEAEGLVHRADAGGVQLDLRTPEEVAESYRALAADFGPRLRRVLVQPLVGGVEVLIGVVQEPVFGPLVVFGLGGAATDVHGDRVARLTPMTDTDAEEMIRTVRGAQLLLGRQGGGLPVDTAALAGALIRVSRLADDLPEVSELDLNPVVASADGIHCVDVRVRISPAEPTDPFLRQLR